MFRMHAYVSARVSRTSSASSSLADIATREDRVCVLNILGGESQRGHADQPRLLRRQRRLRHLAGARAARC